MTAVLYATLASGPCAAVERALELKRMPYRRVELIPVVHKVQQQLRFGAPSVPAVAFDDGARVSGSRAILRELDRRVAEPALLPTDEAARPSVERAEEWGDQVLQPIVRRVVWAALRRRSGALMSYGDGAKPPIPVPMARLSAPLLTWLAVRADGAADPAVRADLLALPGHLARVDGWLAEGVLGGEAENAADLQIASSLRLLLTIEDVAPLIDARPAGALARRVFAHCPGRVPAGVLPAGWVPSSDSP